MAAVRELGLEDHPVVQEVMRQHDTYYKSNRFGRKELVDVIYHCDAETVFAEPTLKPLPGPGGPDDRQDEWVTSEPVQVCKARCAIQHLQALLDSEHVYSFRSLAPSTGACVDMNPLSAIVNPRPEDLEQRGEFQFVSESGIGERSAQAIFAPGSNIKANLVSQFLFFAVETVEPSKFK